jgi:PAS domain S-box-containing protein
VDNLPPGEEAGEDAAALRSQAEDRLRARAARASDAPADPAVQRVLHELEVHQIELELQNEELRRSQADLEVARAKYFDLYDLAPVGYLTLGAPDRILQANLTAGTLLGVDRRTLIGQALTRFLVREDQDRCYVTLRQVFAAETPQDCEVRAAPPRARPVWLRLDANLAPAGRDEPAQCRVILSDLTDRKRAEAALQRAHDDLDLRVRARTAELAAANLALQEDNQRRLRAEEGLRQALADKETLLREVHHRTKNNLQMLCDLLYLQMGGTPEGEKHEALQDTYSRIYAIARLHEHLYQALQGGRVPLDAYLPRIVEGLAAVYPQARVRTDFAAADLAVDLDRAVHVGLIVNELATNALKHAFPNGPGEVVVRLDRMGPDVALQVRDSGRGLPTDFDISATRSLGLRIVQILGRRLGARLEVTSAGGAAFTLTFPLEAEPLVEPRGG